MGKNNTVYLNNSYENIDDFYESVDREYGLDMTPSHQAYVDAIKKHILTIAIGPAGTGKTVFAARVALDMLKAGQIEKIIVTRPAIEAEKGFGALPGTIEEKFQPYVQPVEDLMNELDHPYNIKKYMERGQIQAKPLSFMRGVTHRDAFIILDESQNATASQIKLLLTRTGENSKVVLTGDTRQVDLKPGQSGLGDAIERLSHLKDVALHKFTVDDIKRSGFVKDIIMAYEEE